MSLRILFSEQSHALCCCEAFLRSSLTLCVIAKFICVAVLRFLSLRDFSCVAISRVVLLRDFSAERFHALCHCEIYLRSGLTHCIIARFLRSNLTRCVVADFFCEAISRIVSLRNFCLRSGLMRLCRCETFLHTTLKLTTSLLS